jgi:hypothetical protein
MLAGVVEDFLFDFLGLSFEFPALLLPLIPSMAVVAVIVSFTLTGIGVVIAGIVDSLFISPPMINQIEGDDDDSCN